MINQQRLFLLLCLFISLLNAPLKAEIPPSGGPSKFEDSFRKWVESHSKVARIDSQFRMQKEIKAFKISIESEGNVTIDRDRGILIWETLKPARSRWQLEADKIRMSEDGGTERVLNLKKLPEKLTSTFAIQHLRNLFLMQADESLRNFRIKSGGKNFVTLEPQTDSSLPFTSLEIHWDRNAWIKEVVIHEVSGDQMRLSFSKTILKKPDASHP